MNMIKFIKSILSNINLCLFPQKHNKKVCGIDGLWNEYFKNAEQRMQKQWETIIWPEIKNFDFTTVLELAPGAGRNTEKLSEISKTIYAIDYNDYALKQLKERFEKIKTNCEVFFYKNNGTDLKMIKDNSITCIYCWDAAVHFDKAIIKGYLKEFARVLKKDGKGFFHHSNLGLNVDNDISKNPRMRSRMSKELFAKYCEQANLKITKQSDLPWCEIIDCISIFQK